MTAILALARKDLRLLFRNRGHLFFTFAWPLIVALFFGLVFGGPSKGTASIKVVTVDEDRTEGSTALLGRLATTEGLDVSTMPKAQALQSVRRGERTAAIIVPPGFGAASQRLFHGTPPTLTVAVDPSRRAEAAMLEGLLMAAASKGLQRVFSDADYSQRLVDDSLRDVAASPDETPGKADLTRFLGELRSFVASPAARSETGGEAGTAGGWTPLVVEKSEVRVQASGPQNAFMVTFPQGALWGVIGCAFGFALSLVIERTRGTLTRLQVAPLTRIQVLGGKALACFTAIVLVEVLLFGIGRLALGVVPASVPLLVLAGLSVAVGFVGIMMLISVLGRTEQSVGGVAWAVLLPMSMFGGGMVPLFAMPVWMRTVGNLSPVKWGILALEGALWRGFTLQEMLVPCGVLLAVGIVGFLVGSKLFKS